MRLMYLYKFPPFYFICAPFIDLRKRSRCIHNMLKCHWCHDSNINPDGWQHISSFAKIVWKDSVNINAKKKKSIQVDFDFV